MKADRHFGFVATLLVAGSLVAWPAAAAPAPTRVVFTVDAETNASFTLPHQMDVVCSNGSACGAMEIVRVLDQRGWSATFFLNVYERRKWGEVVMRDIAGQLQMSGQDVELHTHPQWAYDPSRWAMYQYSLDEQTAIVRDGVRTLQTWTGRPVVAHRAGAYTADERTLVALQRNGVLIDSSLMYGNADSRLNGLGLLANRPSWREELAEIPVSVYYRGDRPEIFERAFAPVETVRKIDPNWFVNADEARAAIDSLVDARVPFLIVFLHSYSFLKAPAADGAPLADRHAMDMFNVIVDQVQSHGLEVVTMRQVAAVLDELPAADRDIVPQVRVPAELHSYLWRRLKRSDQRWRAYAAGAVVFIGAVLLIRRRAGARTVDHERVKLPASGVSSP